MAYKRILVPIDGSPTSGRGLREANPGQRVFGCVADLGIAHETGVNR